MYKSLEEELEKDLSLMQGKSVQSPKRCYLQYGTSVSLQGRKMRLKIIKQLSMFGGEHGKLFVIA